RLGEITPRKAEVIAPVAVGDQQGQWLLRAKAESVRALQKAVNAPPDPEDEILLCASAAIPEGKLTVLQEGLRWGGIVVGQLSTRARRVEAWAQEYYGAHPAPPEDATHAAPPEDAAHGDPPEDAAHAAPPEDDAMDDATWRQKCAAEMDSLKERLEQETRLWADLVAVDPLRGIEFSGEIDPWRIDAELKRLMEMRKRWDEV